MVRRLFAVLALAAVPFFAIPAALAPGAGAAPPGPIQGCMHGGWQTLRDASGQPFPNQGQCIAYAIHHPVSLADLTGTTLTGTAIFTQPADGCGFASQEFDGSYLGSASVGTVTFHIAGCVNNFVFPTATYAGSFTITTNVGSVSGTAAGPVTVVVVSVSPSFGFVDFDLILSVQRGTGLFTGTTGSLAFQTNYYPASAPPTFSGTISIP